MHSALIRAQLLVNYLRILGNLFRIPVNLFRKAVNYFREQYSNTSYNWRSCLPCTALPFSHSAAYPRGVRHSMYCAQSSKWGLFGRNTRSAIQGTSSRSSVGKIREGIREGKETAILIKSLFLEIKIYMANYRRAHNRLRKKIKQKTSIGFLPMSFVLYCRLLPRFVPLRGWLCRFARAGN